MKNCYFSTYDLKSFSKSLKKIRKSLGYTRQTVSILSGLSISAIYRLESGLTIPRYDTLEILSRVYKINLTEILTASKSDVALESLYKLLDFYLQFPDLESLMRLEVMYKELISSTHFINKVDPVEWKQFELYFYSLLQYAKNKNLKDSVSLIVKSIQLNTPCFSLENMNFKIYTGLEVRMLYTLSSLLITSDEIEKSLNLLTYIYTYKNVYISTLGYDIIIRVIALISYCHHIMDNTALVLQYCNEGIELSVKEGIIHSLPVLYFRKGIALRNSSKEESMEYLSKSLYSLYIQNNYNLLYIYMDCLIYQYKIKIPTLDKILLSNYSKKTKN